MIGNENNILEGIRNGDEAVFELVFRKYYPALCGYALKYLNDQDQAEEIVQELFFNLWKKRDRILITGSLEAYLFRAVRNASFNSLKHFVIRDQYKMENERNRIEDEGNPGDPMVALELQVRIDQCIDELPPERRKVFMMSRYDGFKYREIAEKLGISVKTVEVQMGKALKDLRKALADYLPLLLMILYVIYKHDGGV